MNIGSNIAEVAFSSIAIYESALAPSALSMPHRAPLTIMITLHSANGMMYSKHCVLSSPTPMSEITGSKRRYMDSANAIYRTTLR